MGEDICQRDMSDKGLIFKIYKEPIHLNIRKTNNLIKIWAEDLNSIFPRRYTDGQTDTRKDA